MAAFTPLIKPLNEQGTTFYTFSSAAKDLSKCWGNAEKEFVFSKFVCLNLPDFFNIEEDDINELKENYKNFTQIAGLKSMMDRIDEGEAEGTGQRFAELLQDYVFNMEELLISSPNYNTDNSDRSATERVFWKFLKELGVINFKEGGEEEVAASLISREEKRYVEGLVVEDEEVETYERVVQYVGSIDMINNVDIRSDTYTELYLHIPSEAGNTADVLFKECYDDVYAEGETYTVSNNYPNFILGQTEADPGLDISTLALYDESSTEHSYTTGDSVKEEGVENELIDEESRYLYRSNLDGVCVDFDANSYNKIVTGRMVTIDDFNKSKYSTSFEFNTILVYYDVVDKSSGSKTTNLYGVLFLDNVQHTENSYDYLQRYPKYKPEEGVQNGNSYGFKLNLRIDVDPNKQGESVVYVNDYNTYSLDLFSDAMTKMKDAYELFLKASNKVTKLDDRLTDLENILLFMTNYQDLVKKVGDLEEALENANLAFSNRNTLIDLIAKNTDDISSIISGRLNLNLQYNTDVIKPGYDVDIDTSVPNQITINSNHYGYALSQPLLKDDGSVIDKLSPLNLHHNNRTDNDVIFRLKPSSNMIRIWVDDEVEAAYDIVIYVDDSLYDWKEGQNVRVVFENLTSDLLNNHSIIFKTDRMNRGGDGEWGREVVVNNVNIKEDSPIFELICVDSTLSSIESFVCDKLR